MTRRQLWLGISDMEDMEDQIGSWDHRSMSPREDNANPTESEFFRGEGFADAITREAIQNSLDAGRGADPVVVKIERHSDEDALSPEKASKYLNSLWPHLTADEVEIKDLPDPEGPLDFITIEDFNTRGLVGDPSEHGLLSGSDPGNNDFYWFWRNRGRSGKGETQRGRWGVGKFAFPSASRINAFWGYTTRETDEETMLMGQSVLEVHSYAGNRCAPVGYYGYLRDEDSLPMPLTMSEHPTEVSQFADDFSVSRDEPGLSLVIPYPENELSSEAVTRSAIRHYFYPILGGNLVVEVKGDDSHQHLTSSSLRDVTEALDWEGHGTSESNLQSLFDFTDWAISRDEEDLTELASDGEDSAPSWDEDKFGENLEELQERFENGDRIALQAPIAVKPRNGENTLSYFHIYLEVDEDLEGSEEHYVREGLTIPDIDKLSHSGVRGLVVVEDDALSSLLGDSENPAHTSWNERNEDVKDYEHGPTTVRYVVQALNKVVGFLSRPSEGMDTELLSDFFFLPETDSSGEEEGAGEGGEDSGSDGEGGGTSGGTTTVNGDSQPLRIVPAENGFTVTSKEDVETPNSAHVEVAYVTGRGDPFNRYDPNDFQLRGSEFDWSMNGASFNITGDNTFAIEVWDEDFSISVEGFDERRDLTVRVIPSE